MPRNSDSDDPRPKKSWREIDKMRDRSRQGSRREDVARQRVEKSPVYEQYKAQVSKLLGGESLPEVLREKLDPTGEIKARDALLKKLKTTEDRRRWAELVVEFTQKFEPPEDAYVLVSWLDHPRDAVVDRALAKLEKMSETGLLAGPKVPRSIDQRLRSLELTATDPDVQSRAKALRDKVRV